MRVKGQCTSRRDPLTSRPYSVWGFEQWAASCKGGVKYLAELFADTNEQILIVGENDKKDDGQWPGRDGARTLAAALARELGGRVRWTMPPMGFKDVREWLIREVSHDE